MQTAANRICAAGAILTRMRSVFLLIAWIIVSPTLAADVVSTWDGAIDDWTSNHWSSPDFPNNGNDGFTYDAVIGSGTVTLDQDITIEGLTLSGGILTGTSSIALNDLSSWTAGTMSGTGQTVIAPAGTLLIDGSNNHYLERTLVNNGSATWTGYNNLILKNGTFQNNGTFTADVSLPSVDSFGDGGTNVFNNAGTFIKQGVGLTRFFNLGVNGVTFNNTGTVDVREGLLVLGSGGTHTGDFTGLGGGTLEFRDNHTFAVGSDITGGLNVQFSSGTNTYNGSIHTTGAVTMDGGTTTVNGSLSAGTLNITGGTAILNGSLAASGGGTISGGTLSSSANWQVSGGLTWTGGTMSGTGQTVIAPAGTLLIDGSNNHYLERTLVNNGSATWTGYNNLILKNGTFQNNGTFTADVSLPSVDSFGDGGTNVFNNAGTFIKQGVGLTRFFNLGVNGVTFNNTGTVDVREGLLVLGSGGTHTGDFTGLGGGTLEFRDNHTFAVGSDITGGLNVQFSSGTNTYNGSIHTTGAVTMDGGTTTVNGSLSAGTLNITGGTAILNGSLAASGGGTISGGTLSSSANWQVSGGLTWTGGTMSGTGQTVIAPAGTLLIDGSNNHYLERTLVNNGSATWTGYNNLILKNGTFQNNGTFTADVSLPSVDSFGDGGTNVFNNAGTFIKQGVGLTRFFNLGVNGVTFNNSGTVNVHGGTLSLEGGGSGAGEFIVAPGATLLFVGSGFNYSGGITLNGGTLQLTNYTLENGTLQGSGTIAATTFTNASEVSPGHAADDEVGAILVTGAICKRLTVT